MRSTGLQEGINVRARSAIAAFVVDRLHWLSAMVAVEVEPPKATSRPADWHELPCLDAD